MNPAATRSKRKANPRRRWLRSLKLAPPVLVLAMLYLGALISVLLQSVGYAPLYGIHAPTLRYYAEVFGASGFWRSLGLTLLYALAPTVLGTLLSVPLALSLRSRFRGRSLLSGLCKLPLLVPYLVGVALTMLLWSNGGLVARALFAFGVIGETGDFPRLLNAPNGVGVMLVYLWKQVPFQTLILSSVLAGMDDDLEPAARTLGARPFQVLWHVTLPRLAPGVASATLIVFAFNFGGFEVPLILGLSPNTLPVEAWRAFSDPDTERRLYGAALVTVLSAVLGLLLGLFLGLYRGLERHWGRV